MRRLKKKRWILIFIFFSSDKQYISLTKHFYLLQEHRFLFASFLHVVTSKMTEKYISNILIILFILSKNEFLFFFIFSHISSYDVPLIWADNEFLLEIFARWHDYHEFIHFERLSSLKADSINSSQVKNSARWFIFQEYTLIMKSNITPTLYFINAN